MIAALGLDHVGLRVADFRRSTDFYRRFGFEVIREDLHERVVVLRHASGVCLNLLDSGTRRGPAHNVLMDAKVKHPGYTHVALRVPDLKQVMHALAELGIAITEGPVTFGDGKTSVFIRDPDRNVIELTH